MHYVVTLAVELDDCETPEEAARAGYGIMTDPGLYPPIMTVRDETGAEIDVDLAEDEG